MTSNIQKNRRQILFSLIFGLFAMFVFIQAALAARVEKVNSLQINNLLAYQGQYMTVIFTLGIEPFLSVGSNQITLTKIKKISGPVEIKGNSLVTPAAEISKEGVSEAYNFIVVVVHPQPTFIWVNADRSVPEGIAQSGSSSVFTHIEAISKSEYMNILEAQQGAELIMINF